MLNTDQVFVKSFTFTEVIFFLDKTIGEKKNPVIFSRAIDQYLIIGVVIDTLVAEMGKVGVVVESLYFYLNTD